MRLLGADRVLSAPLEGMPDVLVHGQGSLLDVALDPEFGRNRVIFWSYAEARGAGNGTTLAKGVLVEAGDGSARIDGAQVVFRQEPALDSRFHFGSRIEFDREGNLFLSLGDRAISVGRVQAQDLSSHLGKIIRLRRDGGIPDDNPFARKAGARPEIWSYGHRNVQGMAFEPDTGALWTVEHGARGGDELNRPLAGRDYGWPSIAYGIEYGGAPIGEGKTRAEGMEQPVYYWDPVIAPSSLSIYDGRMFPAWRGSMLIGGLASRKMVRLRLRDGRVAEEEWLLTGLGLRIRDVKQAPDGSVYVLGEGERGNGQLLRVTPEEAATRPRIDLPFPGAYPESVTSLADGTLVLGSLSGNTIYRVPVGSEVGEPWIRLDGDPVAVYGVLADPARNRLWACAVSGGRGRARSVVYGFRLDDGRMTERLAFPEQGRCNDIAVAGDGALYATDIEYGRVLVKRLQSKALEVLHSDEALRGIDGIVVLGDALYANNYRTHELYRMSAAGIEPSWEVVRTSRPLQRPDGMRVAPDGSVLVAEGGGRLSRLLLDGASVARVETLADGFIDGPTSVTVARDHYWVLESKFRMRRSRDIPRGYAVQGVAP